MVGLSGEPLPDQPETPPELAISRGPDLRLSWPLSARNYVIEFKNNWDGEWTRLDSPGEERDGSFQTSINFEAPSRFFRLRRDSTP